MTRLTPLLPDPAPKSTDDPKRSRGRPRPARRRVRAGLVGWLALGLAACGDGTTSEPPPQVVASIDRMVAYGDCDSDATNPGDFYFDLAVEEEVPAAAAASPGGVRPRAAADPVYVALDVIDGALVQPSSGPDPVDVSDLWVSTPFPVDERFVLRVTFGVEERDPGGVQWSAREERPLTWYPDEACWKQYGDKGCVDDVTPIWEGSLDLGSPGTYCDVEIDWSISVR